MLPPNGPLVFANLTLIGSASVTVTDQSLSLINVPISGTAPADSLLVVEIFAPDGSAGNNQFFVGSNDLEETAPTYVASVTCGTLEPTPTADIGFPNMHMVMVVYGDAGPGCGDDVSWLALTPTSGSTLPGGSSAITVRFNSTGLTAGTYTGSVCITSNDPGHQRVTIPVTLTVTGTNTHMLFLPVIRK